MGLISIANTTDLSQLFILLKNICVIITSKKREMGSSHTESRYELPNCCPGHVQGA